MDKRITPWENVHYAEHQYKKMTPEQERHLQMIKDEFVKRVDAKYRAGQKEHGGDLWNKDSLAEALPEAIDLFVYIITELLKRKNIS